MAWISKALPKIAPTRYTLDLLLYAWENKVPVNEVCRAMSLTEEQVKRAFRDFTAKAIVAATRHLHTMPPKLTALT